MIPHRAAATPLLLCALLGLGGPVAAQSPDLVYLSNLSVTEVDGTALETIEEQTAATLELLGDELREHGLDYRDVVAANVFLRDARHFTGMNGAYREVFSVDPPTRATVQADLLDPNALVQVSVVAARGEKQVISPAAMQSPALPYSWGIRTGNTVFVAGATSRDPDTYEPVRGAAGTQTARVFGNIALVLEAAGSSAAHLVSCRVFLDDPRRYGAMNEAYAAAVPADDPPARATVRAGLMNPVFNTEIQCVAVDSPTRSVVIAAGRERSSLPFSPAIDTGDRVYLSGMVGRGEDVEEKTASVLETLRSTLAAAGLDFGSLEDVWVYLTDIRQWETVSGVLDRTLPPGAPFPTVVGTPLVGDFDVEIQMVARR